jgi:hypothetical protein
MARKRPHVRISTEMTPPGRLFDHTERIQGGRENQSNFGDHHVALRQNERSPRERAESELYRLFNRDPKQSAPPEADLRQLR